MAKAKKLPSGNWRVLQYVCTDENGKKQYKSFTAPTKKEAEFMASEYVMKNKAIKEDLTVEQAIQNYIDSREHTLSVTTIRGYYTIKNNAIGSIKHLYLSQLNELILQKWINQNAKQYSSKSLSNQMGLITAVAKQNKLDIDFSSIALKPPVKREMLIPTKEQMAIILSAVEGTSVELPVTIALTLGLRQSEIAALHWTDYDGKSLSIHSSKLPDKNNQFVEVNRNKSYASTRCLMVPAVLKARLDAAARSSDHICDMLPSSVQRKFKKICNRAGLPGFTMHGLRHANASIMLLENVPDKYAMERLGQSTASMLKNVYQHTFKDAQQQIADNLDNVFSDIADVK